MRKTKKNTIKKTEGELPVDDTIDTSLEGVETEEDIIDEECSDEDIDAMIDEVSSIEEPVIEEPVIEKAPAQVVEKSKKNESKKETTPQKMVYRFFGVYNNLNVVGYNMNGARVPHFEVISTSLEDALSEYKLTTMNEKKMSMKQVHDYFKRLYGKRMRVEVLPIDSAKDIHTIEL